MVPDGCHLWNEDAFEWSFSDSPFERVSEFYDFSHEWRGIVRCQRCGQLYVDDHVETGTGDAEKIWSTHFPVSDMDLTKIDFKSTHPLQLLFRNLTPRLIIDESGTRASWVR
jgi:hypothetical protein